MCRQYCLDKCHNKDCLLSHNTSVLTTPFCRYFMEGTCNNPTCKFVHHKPRHFNDADYEIWTCRPFAIGGHCARGIKCPFIHQWTCPDYEEDGSCPRGILCTLTHQVTKRTQQLMATPSNKYVCHKANDESVVVGDDEESAGTKEGKLIISSYTVLPQDLFVTCQNGRYDFYIDNDAGKQEALGSAPGSGTATPNTFSENQAFEIALDSSGNDSDTSSGGSDGEENAHDALEVNDDYVRMGS